MRKRAQSRFKPTIEEQKTTVQQHKPLMEKKPLQLQFKKNTWIAITLLGIFFLVLFFNTYFNLTSNVAYNPEGQGLDKYYLSGPDPYYNLRHVKGTYETGRYPYYTEKDPLLNYPRGASGGRAPLLNMMALGFSRLLTPFMDEADAIGRSMQFVPALFGALLVFPVYFLGKKLFNWKAGLVGAFFSAVIPIHIGSGHGSAYSLFDHDSFNLLMFFTTYLFLVMSLREKDHRKSLLYAVLGGVSLAGLTMTWVDAQFLYVVITIYTIIQIVIDIFLNKFEIRMFTTPTVLLFTGYLISLPVLAAKPAGLRFDIPLLLCIGVAIFGSVYYVLSKKKVPWVVSLPGIFILAGAGLTFIYYVEYFISMFQFLSPLRKLSKVIFGSGIYGTKVSNTIAEANTFQISNTVMSFGPALYWIAWAGFVFLIWRYYKNKTRRDYLFIIILFIIDIWLTGIAGRFLNDMVPIVALLSGWIIWLMFSKLDFKQMIKNIRSAGGGFHGLRRGIKLFHIFGIIFIVVIVILPNVFITLDAAVPNKVYQKKDGNWSNLKWEVFGEGFSGAYGLSVNKEIYWSDAFHWLDNQDVNISPPEKRPAFISWWDYGFYEVALGGHPTVADNFQDGIPPAANFHTATSEKEAVIVWIVRLLEGDKGKHNGKISSEVKKVLEDHLGINDTAKIVRWMENPISSPSYGQWIDEEFNKYIQEEKSKGMLTVGVQWPENAVYHDVIKLLTNDSSFSDEQLTRLYHDIQNVTGLSIRYYGVEGYDRQIFNIFAYLADKSLVLEGAPEDEFIDVLYSGYKIDPYTKEKERDIQNEPLKDYLDLSDNEKRLIAVTGTSQRYKDPYFNTMFYKTYIGPYKEDQGTKSIWDGVQHPCINMKHFYAEYISDMSNPLLQYFTTGKAAVVIAKYYEGAFVNGTVLFNGQPINNSEVVIQKNVTYSKDFVAPIDHDKDLILVDENPSGNFSLLAGAGSRLLVRRYPEIVSPKFFSYGFPLEIIDFNSTSDKNEFPITDDDAMRKSDNYERYLNITIEPGRTSGYVYENLDDNDTFNASTDEPIKNAEVYLWEVLKFDEQAFKQSNNGALQPLETSQTPIVLTTNETGFYSSSDLLPGYYVVQVFADNYRYIYDMISLSSGNTSYNVSKPKLAGLKGIVYYDKDLDGGYTSGDEISGATVDLVHNGETIKTTTTNSTGWYSFDSLIPGKINGMDLNEYTVKVKTSEYQATETVYPEENKTTTLNISLELIPVEVTGKAVYKGTPISDVRVDFEPDMSEDKNTAENNSAITDENGEFTVELKPGKYNYAASKTEGSIVVYNSTTLYLTLSRGETSHPVDDIVLTKRSVTVTGTTTYNGTAIDNVSISFYPDYEKENNTAGFASTTSDAAGVYTVELSPGFYVINVNKEETDVNGVNYTYSVSNETKTLVLLKDYIDTGYNFEIKLERAVKESD